MKKRKGWIKDGLGYIPLTKGQISIVDADNVSTLEKYNWAASWNKRLGAYYAMTSCAVNGKRVSLLMHRVILNMSVEDKRHCDHRDGNTLNNRRENLRPATRS